MNRVLSLLAPLMDFARCSSAVQNARAACIGRANTMSRT